MLFAHLKRIFRLGVPQPYEHRLLQQNLPQVDMVCSLNIRQFATVTAVPSTIPMTVNDGLREGGDIAESRAVAFSSWTYIVAIESR